MEVKNCKTCGKQFLSETDNSYCRICNKKWYEKQGKIREQAENLKWQEQKEQERKLFEAKVQTYKPILMESVNPSAHTLYIIGNGFDLMHRVPSSYYNFRDSLGKNNSLRYSLETALTAEDIWADFENALGTLNLNLMGSRNIIDMWLDDFGVYGDEDSGAAEFYMAVEAAAAPMIYGDSGWDKKMSYRLIGRAFPQQRLVSFKITDAMQIENGRVLTEM